MSPNCWISHAQAHFLEVKTNIRAPLHSKSDMLPIELSRPESPALETDSNHYAIGTSNQCVESIQVLGWGLN